MIKTLEIQIDVPDGATHYSMKPCGECTCEGILDFWKIDEEGKFWAFIEFANKWEHFDRICEHIKPIIEVQND